jgi:hypothetical protein
MKKEISYQEFSAAADKLYSAGEVPTALKLQASLGKGTLAEINQQLKTWQDLKTPHHSILDGSKQASAVSVAVQELLLHSDADSLQTIPAPIPPDAGIDPENNSEVHAALSELMRENKVLTEKIIELTAELNTLKEQTKPSAAR